MGSSPTSGILKKSAIIIASKTRPSSARGNKKKVCGFVPGASVRDGARVSCLRRWFVIFGWRRTGIYILTVDWGRCVLCVVCEFCLRVAALLQLFCVAGLTTFADDAPICIYSLWGSSPRPMAHKAIALTTELKEPLRTWLHCRMMQNKLRFCPCT